MALREGNLNSTRVFLSKNPKLVEIKNSDGLTPLMFASNLGYAECIEELLVAGADPKEIYESRSCLQTAVSKGYFSAVKVLYPFANQEDINQCLFIAIQRHQEEIFDFLLENDRSGDLNALINRYGGMKTSLYLFACYQGTEKIVDSLIKRGITSTAICETEEKEKLFQIALLSRSDHLIQSFLEMELLGNDELIYDNPIQHYYEELLNYKYLKLLDKQIFALDKLSDFFLLRNFFKSARLLTNARNLLKNQPFTEAYFLNKLKMIEVYFLQNMGVLLSSEDTSEILIEEFAFGMAHFQRLLISHRENCKTLFLQRKPLRDVLKTLAQGYRGIFKRLVLACQERLGHPPVKWVCMGVGPLAHEELLSFAEIKFVFVIEESTPEALNYFRLLAELVELKMICLEEAPPPPFCERSEQTSLDDFSLAAQRGAPRRDQNTYALIGTPQELAAFQKQKEISIKASLSHALATEDFIVGSSALLDQYRKEKNRILSRSHGFLGSTQRTTLALRLLTECLEPTFPDLTQEEVFDIYKDLYQPLQEMIHGLALFYNLAPSNILDRVQQLVNLDIFCSQGGEQIKKAINKVFQLLLEATLFSPTLSLDERHFASIEEIYRILLPFRNNMRSFCQAQSKKALHKALFYGDNFIVRGIACQKTLRYQEAREAFRSALAAKPNDLKALYGLSQVEQKLGNHQYSQKLAIQALTIAKKMNLDRSISLALNYNHLGITCYRQKNWESALKSFQKALKMSVKIYDKKKLALIPLYLNMALTLEAQNRELEALDYYHKITKTCGSSHEIFIASIWQKIGEIFLSYGEDDMAMGSFNTGLAKLVKRSEQVDLMIARLLNKVGIVLCGQQRYEDALKCHEKALFAFLELYEEPRVEIAETYAYLANGLQGLKQVMQAQYYREKACELMVKIYDEEQLEFARLYTILGSIYKGDYLHKKDLFNGLSYHEKALQIRLKKLDKPNHELASSYLNVGDCLCIEKKYEEALTHFNQALEIYSSICSEPNARLALAHLKIGAALRYQEKYSDALVHLEKSLEINLKDKWGSLNLAANYDEIGYCLRDQNSHAASLQYFYKALELYQESGEDSRIAAGYNNIGSALHFKGESKDRLAALNYHEKALEIYLKLYKGNEESEPVATSKEFIARASSISLLRSPGGRSSIGENIDDE